MHNVLIISLIAALSFLTPVISHAQNAMSIEIDKRLSTADSLRRRVKFSDAWNQLSLVSGLEDSMNAEQLALYYKVRGVTQVGLRKYPEALESYSKSESVLETLSTPKSKVDLVNLYTLRGTVYNKTGDYEKAKNTLLEGVTSAQELPEESKIKALKYIYNNLGETYELLGQYDEAVKTNYLALDIIGKLGQEVSVGAGVANNNLGICYRQLGRFNLAKEHYNKAAEIFGEALGPNNRYTHAALGNAATTISDFGEIEKAIPILNRRLEVYQQDVGADQMYIVNTYSSLGYIYKRIGDYEKSIESYERALGKLRSMGDYSQNLEIRLLTHLAASEMHVKSSGQARIYLDEAFKIKETTLSFAPADAVRLHYTDATNYMLNDDSDGFYLAIEKANRISSEDIGNRIGQFLISRPRYIDALIDRNNLALARLNIDSTEVIISTYATKIHQSDLTLIRANLDGLRAKLACASGSVEQAFAEKLDEKLIEHTNTLIAATASTPGKKNQRFSCSTCFNVGHLLDALANLHLQAFQKGITPDQDHLQSALAFLDIKQSYLTNIWKNEHFSDLPEKERQLAKEIRQRIAAYDLLIFENSENSPAGLKQNALYVDSILALRPQLADYIDQLGSKPLDFTKKFDFDQLAEDQAVLLFHQEDDLLHLLLVHQAGVLHHSVMGLSKLRFKLTAYNTFCQSENTGFGESLETLAHGAELYRDLIGWIPAELQSTIARIAIIEGNPIESIPFAALLMKPPPAGAKGFRDLNFAVEKYAFSYHQSPTEFFEAQQKNHFGSSINLTALAPSQISSEAMVATGTSSAPTMGLEYANQEVEALIKKFNGNLLIGKQADFSGLLTAFNNSNVVHIASHASSNYSDGEYSYIVITDTTQLSGERLYARTLSELELPADLVVLAACESGKGKLRGGEGTVSLSSIFLNAGTQSVLHTSWRVEDKRSQDVLLNFYNGLDEEQPLDQALVLAQRAHLQSAGGQYLHPFYWSAFAVSGNLSPIESNWLQLLYFGAPIALLVLLILFWKRK